MRPSGCRIGVMMHELLVIAAVLARVAELAVQVSTARQALRHVASRAPAGSAELQHVPYWPMASSREAADACEGVVDVLDAAVDIA